MQTFRTLDLAKEFYALTRNLKLPKHLREQFLRCSSSIALNLAEGNVKTSRKEKLRYFEIALGSFRESMVVLDLEGIVDDEIARVADRLGGSLFKLNRALDHDDTPF